MQYFYCQACGEAERWIVVDMPGYYPFHKHDGLRVAMMQITEEDAACISEEMYRRMMNAPPFIVGIHGNGSVRRAGGGRAPRIVLIEGLNADRVKTALATYGEEW